LSVLPFYALHEGSGRLVVGALTSLAFGLGIGYLLLGPSGRDRFLTMMRTTRRIDGPLKGFAVEGGAP
jgi:hypothetical protein